ncbi:START-like domain superfamily [Sesbania bispinosa]|nr:START-like domain superfamily [Sesbania bispinosa]
MSMLGILQRPTTVVDIFGDLMVFITPLWIAVIFGVVVGWAWKPKWAIDPKDTWTNLFKFRFPWFPNSDLHNKPDSDSAFSYSTSYSSSQVVNSTSSLVTEQDLQYLSKLVEEKDGGPAWIQMMDRSTPTMSYQAWRRDPEVVLTLLKWTASISQQNCVEDATPEIVRDFFWDDEFRLKWDDMLIHASIIEECALTGTMLVHWVRKFPFFCSDREYIIGRRIWDAGRAYYCVTKGVPCSSMPRHNKPKRVDLYYSSFCIRPVKSRKDGQLTACEVLLFHYEDMGIPWEIAKLGVRQGMWGAVKKFDPGLRTYQKERASGAPLSRCANAAKINTKVTADYVRSLEDTTGNLLETENQDSSSKPIGRSIPKLLVVGGAIALACTLDQGLLTKAVIFGVARRFAKIGGGCDL